jgi:hypothetical protein
MKRSLFVGVVKLLVALGALAQDVRMNTADHSTGTLDNSTMQSETNHASNGSVIVAGWNDTNQIAILGAGGWQSAIGYGYSATGGASFVDAGVFAPPSGWQYFSDPAVAVDAAGNFYIATLAVNSTTGAQAVAVARSTTTTAPITWGTAAMIAPVSAGDNLDKEFIAVDRTGGMYNGRVYLVASEGDLLPNAAVIVAHSTSPTPLTFSTFSTLTGTDALYHGAMPAVAPNGNVYVVWGRYDFPNDAPPSESILITRSSDGGTTFLNPDGTAAARMIASPSITPPALLSGGVSVRTRDFPYLAIDNSPIGIPTRGNLYVVYQARQSSSDRVSVFFTRSTDSGVTWSSPRLISAAPAVTIGGDTTSNDNWQPTIAVSPVNGHVHVFFYDRRGDPGNSQIRVYQALSTDGGLTWSNAPYSSIAFTPAVGYAPLAVPTYMGDYIWSFADANGIDVTWGDCRNHCAPPPGAMNGCSPTGRGDQDVYYHRVANLSGPDLFIQPWGYVTGIGDTWKSPDIYCVNSSGVQRNAFRGIVNRLRARVRNLGNAAATNAIIRFKYAPWYAGLTDMQLKEIGTATVTLGPLGSGTDDQVVAIDWDLTNLDEDNGSVWPIKIGEVSHFCVKVSVELPSDVNFANNDAQSNFFDVTTSTLMSFLIGNPFKALLPVHISISKLPEGFRATATLVDRRGEPSNELQPGEIGVARLRFVRPPKFRSTHDIVADVSVRVGNEIVGGVSARLARAARAEKFSSPGLPLQSWNRDGKVIVGADQTVKPVPTGQENPPAAKQRIDLTTVKLRGVSIVLTYKPEEVFQAALATMRQRDEAISLADFEKGLINSRSIALTVAQMREFVVHEDFRRVQKHGGRYLFSFVIRPAVDGTEVTASTTIIANNMTDSFLGGTLVRSNEQLERTHLKILEDILKSR